ALMTAGLCMFGAGVVLALILGRDIIRAQTAAAAAARALARGESIPAFESHITEAQELAQGLREAATILNTRLQERDAAQVAADQARTALLEREKSARRAAEALNRAKD